MMYPNDKWNGFLWLSDWALTAKYLPSGTCEMLISILFLLGLAGRVSKVCMIVSMQQKTDAPFLQPDSSYNYNRNVSIFLEAI